MPLRSMGFRNGQCKGLVVAFQDALGFMWFRALLVPTILFSAFDQ